jgi:hypothetical protein
MLLQRFEGLLQRVDDLERASRDRASSSALREDARDLVEELLVYGNQTFNFRKLSLRLEDRHDVDLDSLREAATYLRSLEWPSSVELTPALTIYPAEKLKSLEADIEQLQSLLAKDPAASVALALDFRLSTTLLHLVMAATRLGFSLGRLVDLARKKIDLLHRQQVVQLWSYVQEEFDSERSTHMEGVPGVLPDDFLKFGSDREARDKLARYIVEWKPRLMLELHARKGPGYPLEVPSLPRVLAWRASSTVDAPSLPEMRLAKSIGRIVHIAAHLFHDSVGDLAAVLQLDASSQIIRAGSVIAGSEQPTLPTLCYELRKAVQLLSEVAVVDADFPVAIRRYRWGLEVMAPHLTKEFRKKNELLLQRELARFTLERGFFVVGTRFGRAETDLVSWQKEALYIVETKLFRSNGNVNARSVRRALAQLRNYMDQHPSTPRGVLVLYNLTSSHISAPEHWLGGRFLVVPINMQRKPPSHREHSLEILEGDEAEVIKVVPLTTPMKRRRRRRKAARRKAARKGP